MIENIRLLAKSKRDKTNIEDQNEIKSKLDILDEVLANDNCFFDMSMETAISILNFLGVEENKILDTYYELINPKNYKSEIIYNLEEQENNKSI